MEPGRPRPVKIGFGSGRGADLIHPRGKPVGVWGRTGFTHGASPWGSKTHGARAWGSGGKEGRGRELL